MLRTEVLKRHGVADAPKMTIRPTKPDIKLNLYRSSP
jgi:hypothetical protein